MWCFVGKKGVLPRPPKTRDTRDRHTSYCHNVQIFVPAEIPIACHLLLWQHVQWHLGVGPKLINKLCLPYAWNSPWMSPCRTPFQGGRRYFHESNQRELDQHHCSHLSFKLGACLFAKITVCLFSLQPVWVQGSVLLFLSIFCWGGWIWWSCGSHVKDKCL